MTARESPGAARLRAAEGTARPAGAALAIVQSGVDPLERLEQASQMLAEARTALDIPTRIKPLVDMAETIRIYARQAGLGLEAQNHAAAIKLRAEHRGGELLAEAGVGTGKDPKLGSLGVDRHQSSRWQQIARLPSQTLEAYIQQSEEVTSAGARSLSAQLASQAQRSARAGSELMAVPARPVSVVETDPEALDSLLSIHAVDQPRILDVTYNRGRIWGELPYKPTRLDRDPTLLALGFTDRVADFGALPFEDATWDVVVFDPPHQTDGGKDALGGKWATDYGTDAADMRGPNIEPIFAPFLLEARRVLAPGGIVLAKIADQIHASAYQAQHIAFINAARGFGLELIDLAIKVSANRGSLVDPKWKRVCHLRQIHTYWIALGHA